MFLYYISQRYDNTLLPTPYNLNDKNNEGNIIEIMPVANDGGHYIKLLDRDLCLYQDSTLIQTDIFDFIDYFVPCQYDSKFFKFYFFKTDYLFPEFKVIVNIFLYQIYNKQNPDKVIKNFTDLLKEGSEVTFTNKTTKELRTALFLNNK